MSKGPAPADGRADRPRGPETPGDAHRAALSGRPCWWRRAMRPPGRNRNARCGY